MGVASPVARCRRPTAPARVSGPQRPVRGVRSPSLLLIVAVLALGVTATSSGAVFGRLALDKGSSAIAAAGYRVALAALIVGPIALLRHNAPSDHILRSAGPVAGVALALHFGLWIGSLAWTSVASSLALVTTHPLMVAAASPVLLRERPSRGLLAGVILALAGVLVIAVGDGLAEPEHLRGDLLAVGGAAAFAVYVIVGRRARRVVPLLDYVAVVYAVAAVGLVTTGFLTDQTMTGFTPTVWLLFLGAALVPQLLGHSSFNWALSHVSATYVSGVILAEVLGGTALAWVILGERPPGRAVVGAVLIVVGLYLATRAERQRLSASVPDLSKER